MRPARALRRRRPRTTAPSTRVALDRTASPTNRPAMRRASPRRGRRPRSPRLHFVAERVRVYVEVGGKRTFASAADWPGWCRSGKDESLALENLEAYAPRYAKVAKVARVQFPKEAPSFNVVERLEGNATTDFGAPAMPA